MINRIGRWATAAATGAVALSTAALAADMPVKAPVAALGYSWAGFYLGANGGFSVGRNPSDRQAIFNANNALQNRDIWNLVPAGWLGGVQAGYNWQSNNWVFGLEADIQATGQKDSVCFQSASCGTHIDQRMPWFGTVRGRLGWAAGPVLSYVTGGLAYGRVETDYANVIAGFPTTSGSTHENKLGWTVGSGVEAAIAGNWTAKVEYLYLSFGSIAIPPFNNVTGTSRHNLTSDIRDHIVRVGLNYRLGTTSGTGAATSAAVPFSNWSGFHAGVNGGRGVGRNPSTLATALTGPGTPISNDQWKQSPAGWLGGVQAGYNWQAGQVVFGVEADIQGSRLTDSACVFACAGFADVVDQKISWFGTARGRLGYAAGPALFYVTGGLAYGKLETTITATATGGTPLIVAASSTKSGWTVGGGAEIALAANWSARTEYLYMDLGSTSLAFTYFPGGGGTVTDQTYRSDSRTHIFRGGVSYHFNQPLVARY